MVDTTTAKLLSSIERLGDLLGAWLDLHLINIIAILIGAWLVRHFGATLLNRLLHSTIRPDLYPTKTDREKRIKTLNSLVGAVMRVGVYIIAAILIVGEINPSYTTALFASAGLIGVAVGFGAQSLIRDFVSGIFIITENQYRVGDIVDIGGVSGTVAEVTIRTTVLRDINGYVHHVPNGTITITTNRTIGYSGINEELLVDQSTDMNQLEHIISHIGEQLKAMPEFHEIIIEPPRVASVNGITPNGVSVRIGGRTTPGDAWKVKSEMYRLLRKELQKHKIKLGVPLVMPKTQAK